jgi:hypothetical protein
LVGETGPPPRSRTAAALEDEQRVVPLQHNTAPSGEYSLDVQVVNVVTVEAGTVRRMDNSVSDQYAADAFWSPC